MVPRGEPGPSKWTQKVPQSTQNDPQGSLFEIKNQRNGWYWRHASAKRPRTKNAGVSSLLLLPTLAIAQAEYGSRVFAKTPGKKVVRVACLSLLHNLATAQAEYHTLRSLQCPLHPHDPLCLCCKGARWRARRVAHWILCYSIV